MVKNIKIILYISLCFLSGQKIYTASRMQKDAQAHVDRLLIDPVTNQLYNVSALWLRSHIRETQHNFLVRNEDELDRLENQEFYAFVLKNIARYDRYQDVFQNEMPLKKPLKHQSKFSFCEEDVAISECDDTWKKHFLPKNNS